MGSKSIVQAILHFDIDEYINPLLPGSIVPSLPQPVARFLGHHKSPPPPLPPTIQTFVSIVSAWLGLLAVTAISNFSPQLQHVSTPVLIPSLGAGAVLNYVQSNLPAAQPRPTILGQALSAVAGVSVAKLFELSPRNFDSYIWLSAPTAVALAILLMRLTNNVHPPGGATAVLAVATSATRHLGWWLVVLILVGTTTMVVVGLICNNLFRKWPEFWWTPVELPVKKEGEDEENQKEHKPAHGGPGSDSGSDLEQARTRTSNETV